MAARPVGPGGSDSGTVPPARDVTRSARRWWALVAIAASVLVVGLDLTVLNLALPTMAVSLHASTGDLQWIVDSYSLVLAALILPAGLLGDRYGRKKMLVVALVIFGLASLACAYASSVGELIAARAVLGIGAAAIFPLALSVLPVLFDGADRQRAVAAIGGATMLSFPIGPIAGGYLLDHFWWGSVFLINVPVVVLALVAVTTLLPESRSARRPGIDLPGLVVSSAGLVTLTYGFIKAGQDGWSDATALALIAAGAAVLAVLPLVERQVANRGGQPLADLRLFRSAGFRWGTILATAVSFAMFGIFFALPQYFQDVRGADALGSGVRLLPLVGGMLVGMVAGTGCSRRAGAGRAGQAGQRGEGRARLIVTVGYLRDGDRDGARRVHHAQQLHRVHARLGRAGRPRPRPGDAVRHERRPRRAVRRAQRGRLGAAHRDAPGRLHDRRGRARHRDQQQLRQRRGARPRPPSRRGPPPLCTPAWARARPWHASSARPRCSTTCGPPSCTAWT